MENSTYPAKIGVVADINFPPFISSKVIIPDYIPALMHLGDLLILHDTVTLRLDMSTIISLYQALDIQDIEVLLKNKRLEFIPSMSSQAANGDYLKVKNGKIETGDYYQGLGESITHIFSKGYYGLPTRESVIKQIEKHTIIPPKLFPNESEAFINEMITKFSKSIDTDSPAQFWDSREGFRQGVGRITDIVFSKTPNFYINEEVLYYFSIIENEVDHLPKAKLLSAIDRREREVLIRNSFDHLHTMNNIPSVVSLIANGKWTPKKFMEVVMSDESFKLRKWIQKNYSENLDLRDLYFQTIKDLPSKKNWVSWTRYGTFSALSIALGLLFQNPFLASASGIGAGVFNEKYGDDLVNAISKKYNPESWISYIQRSAK